MPRYAVINKENLVVNVVEWDKGKWKAPDGSYTFKTDIGDIGNIFIPEKKDFDKSMQQGAQPIAQPIPEKPWLAFSGAARRGELV